MYRRWRCPSLVLLFALVTGCRCDRGRGPAQAPEQDVRLPLAADRDPDPAVLEVELSPRVGGAGAAGDSPELSKAGLWSYGGTVPGPLLRARRGDTLVVHLDNRLPGATAIDWHGVRVPAALAGARRPATAAGARDSWRFTLPDAGLYWLRPRAPAARELVRGLYAPLLVDDPDEPPGLGDGLVLVLSDAAGVKQDVADDAAWGPEGFEGETVLVNGRVKPVLGVARGTRLRWRVVNAASTRFFLIALPGHTLTRIGGDGGLIEAPLAAAQVLLSPGERADLTLVPDGAAGAVLPVLALPHDRGLGLPAGPRELFYLRLGGEPPAAPPAPLPAKLRAIEPLAAQGATPVSINVNYDPAQARYVVLVDDQPAEGRPVRARVGETQRWSLVNGSEWDQPFHLEGFFFQVLDLATEKPVRPLEWKDTVNVPAREIVELLVRFDDRPGRWSFHGPLLDVPGRNIAGGIELAP
jgi:FtsP/CotA-like multicopper oxidase with cupredoxin domain